MTSTQLNQQNPKSKKSQEIVAVDLFCGVGGLTHGLIESGIKVAAGYDIDETCKFSYEANNKGTKFIAADVGNVTPSEIEAFWKDADVRALVGCAPCQPFSKHTQKRKDKDKDSRWGLLERFGEHIEQLKPDIVSMENVIGLKKEAVFHSFMKILKDNGYLIDPRTEVYCPDYGIPQTRKRLVVLASRLGPIKLIPPTHAPSNYVTVKNIIGGLSPLEAGKSDPKDPLHKAQGLGDINLTRMKQSKPGGTWKDWDPELISPCHTASTGRSYGGVYGRMTWDKPAPTMTTQFYLYGTGRFGHPEQHRAISLREGSMLQTFPKNYKFVEPNSQITFTKIGRYIGNAVPPKLGEIIGKSILNHLLEVNK